jgi:hydrogenase-4 component F
MFAYSSIEHMGIMTLAFGLGGPLASFAGLLHMAMHSLTKSAIFFGVGYVSQLEGTQRIADIRGLTQSQPLLGWLLVIAVAAIAGLPPFGVFTSEFLLITSTFARLPWLAVLLGLGLIIAFSGLALRLHGLAFGESARRHTLQPWRLAPMALHLALVAAAGIYLPGAVIAWFRHVASLLG